MPTHFPKRFFWARDHRLSWLDNTDFKVAVEAPYLKTSEKFIAEAGQLLDFTVAQQADGVMLHGLLRTSHGGLQSARELLAMAAERQLQLLPVIEFGSRLGGFWYEGEHEFNLQTFTEQNPGVFPKQNYFCASNPKVQDWLRRASEWFTRRFDLPGMVISAPKLGGCDCRHCLKSRASLDGDELVLKDLAIFMGPIVEACSANSKEFLLIANTGLGFRHATTEKMLSCRYFAGHCGFEWHVGNLPPGFPPDVIFPKLTEQSDGRHLMRCNVGSVERDMYEGALKEQDYGSFGHAAWLRQEVAIESVKSFCQQAVKHEVYATSLCAEVSTANVANELNYLAYRAFGGDPNLTWEVFAEKYLAPTFGTVDQSQQFLQYTRQLLSVQRELVKCGGPDEWRYLTSEAHLIGDEIVKSLAELSLAGDVRRRWSWLLDLAWSLQV